MDAEGLRFCLTRNPLAHHGCWRGAGSAKSVAKGVVGDTLNEQVRGRRAVALIAVAGPEGWKPAAAAAAGCEESVARQSQARRARRPAGPGAPDTGAFACAGRRQRRGPIVLPTQARHTCGLDHRTASWPCSPKWGLALQEPVLTTRSLSASHLVSRHPAAESHHDTGSSTQGHRCDAGSHERETGFTSWPAPDQLQVDSASAVKQTSSADGPPAPCGSPSARAAWEAGGAEETRRQERASTPHKPVSVTVALPTAGAVADPG